MKGCKNTVLINYCQKHYKDVRVIGIQNPSVIVTHSNKSFVIYRTWDNKKGKYVLACGADDRIYFDNPEMLQEFMK